MTPLGRCPAELETVDLVQTVASLTFPFTPVRLGTKNQNMWLRPIINLDRASPVKPYHLAYS